MPEQGLCYSQAILCIFNEIINIFHSGRFESIHSPVCFVTILPIIENTPPFTMTWLALGKNDGLDSREHDKLGSFSFNGDKMIQTFHG